MKKNIKIVFTLALLLIGFSSSLFAQTSKRSAAAQEVYNSIEWVDISAGTFLMGPTYKEKGRRSDELPQHEVKLSAFSMSKYAITFEQYDAFCEATGREKPQDCGWGRGERPVIAVNWFDAVAFVEWLGDEFRLPTEAEWEYACRAGTTTPFNTGDDLTPDQANCYIAGSYYVGEDGKWKKSQKTTLVGSYAPNAWGLYDMHGNVYEWCRDWFGPYSSDTKVNPHGPSEGSFRVARGGSWDSVALHCRSAQRSDFNRKGRFAYVGFRLVKVSKDHPIQGNE